MAIILPNWSFSGLRYAQCKHFSKKNIKPKKYFGNIYFVVHWRIAISRLFVVINLPARAIFSLITLNLSDQFQSDVRKESCAHISSLIWLQVLSNRLNCSGAITYDRQSRTIYRWNGEKRWNRTCNYLESDSVEF